jgi:Ca-activated chloride channel family protein
MGDQVWQRRLALDSHQQHSGVAALWARHQIADWMDQRLRGGQQEQLRQQIVELALEHQLVSKFTSLVAVDPVQARTQREGLKTAAVANRLPHGSQQNVQGYGFPQTATAAELQLLLGFGCIALAMMLIVIRARYEK